MTADERKQMLAAIFDTSNWLASDALRTIAT